MSQKQFWSKKNWGAENFFGPSGKIIWTRKHFESQKIWVKTNLDKKGFSLHKDFGFKLFFCSNKAHIYLTTTLSLIEVWHWRPKSCTVYWLIPQENSVPLGPQMFWILHHPSCPRFTIFCVFFSSQGYHI